MLTEILADLAATARRVHPEELNLDLFAKRIMAEIVQPRSTQNGKKGYAKKCWHKEDPCELRRKNGVCSLTDGSWKNCCPYDVQDFSWDRTLHAAKTIMTFARRNTRRKEPK